MRILAQTLLPMWIRNPRRGEYYVVDYPYIASGTIEARSSGGSAVLDYETLVQSSDEEMTVVLQE